MSEITDAIGENEARGRVERLRGGAATPQAQADLADALFAWSQALARDDRTADAVAAAEDAVRTLAPVFLATPARHADAMNAMVAHYLGLSQQSNRKPDLALIKPLAVPLGQFGHLDEEDE